MPRRASGASPRRYVYCKMLFGTNFNKYLFPICNIQNIQTCYLQLIGYLDIYKDEYRKMHLQMKEQKIEVSFICIVPKERHIQVLTYYTCTYYINKHRLERVQYLLLLFIIKALATRTSIHRKYVDRRSRQHETDISLYCYYTNIFLLRLETYLK